MRTHANFATLLALLAATSVSAAPTAYPRQPGQLNALKNNSTSTLMGDTDDPRMAWVLPPSAGEASPANFSSANANLGYCHEMADLQSYSRLLAAKVAANALKISDAEGELQVKQNAYEKAQQDAAALVASRQDVQAIQSLSERLSDIETQLDHLMTLQQQQCAGAGTPACAHLDEQITTLQAQHKQVSDELTKVRNESREAYLQYSRAKAKVDAAKDAVDQALNTLATVNAKVIEARKQLGDMYANFARLEGGFAQINYDTGWDQNAQLLRSENPSYRFEKVATHNVRLQVGLVGGNSADSYLASLPAVLDYSINGKSYLPYGNQDADTLSAMPSQMAATLRLSLTGACPLAHPSDFDVPKSQQGLPVFGVAATFEFPAAFQRKVTFSYNLYKFYQKMQSSGSSGGLFWSSSWSKVSESLDSKDAFSADWKESDPDDQTSFEDRRKIEAEVKQELMNRVLKQIATPVFDGQAQFAAAPGIPEHGAIVLANGLQQTCGWYSFYCTGGAWVLRGLDSIFGSSSSEQTFQQTYNVTATETWSTDSVRWKPGVTVFVGKK